MSRAHHPRAAVWEFYFTTTARLTECIEAVLKCKTGLPIPGYSVLLMTDRAGEESVRPFLPAHQVVFSRSCLTRTMKCLEPRGLVECCPCRGDGHGDLASPMPAGKTLLDEAAPVQRDVIHRLFLDDITLEEIGILTGLFTWVSERLDSDTPCP